MLNVSKIWKCGTKARRCIKLCKCVIHVIRTWGLRLRNVQRANAKVRCKHMKVWRTYDSLWKSMAHVVLIFSYVSIQLSGGHNSPLVSHCKISLSLISCPSTVLQTSARNRPFPLKLQIYAYHSSTGSAESLMYTSPLMHIRVDRTCMFRICGLSQALSQNGCGLFICTHTKFI